METTNAPRKKSDRSIPAEWVRRFGLNAKTAPYYFMVPTMLIFCVFMVYPILNSFLLSFQEFKFGEYKFIGLRNYMMLAKDPVFHAALKNTMIYLAVQMPVMLILALFLANLLNQKFIRGKTFFRISIFMPAITGLVAYSLVFMLLLNTDYGMVNYALGLFGISSVEWLNDPINSKIALMMAVTWRWTGYNMIIMIAGLQNIPEEVYEAADIDGANGFQKFFHVTVPMMKLIILFCAITTTIGTLQLFDESYILTKGGPDNATITIAHYLYNTGFRYVNFGYAAAISYVLVFIIAVLSFVQFKLAGKGDEA